MAKLEIGLHWLAITFYVLGTACFVIGIYWRKDGLNRWCHRLTAIGLLPHGIALGLRWLVAGRIPVYGRFEAFSGLVWLGLVIYFLLRRKYKVTDWAAIVIYPTSILILGIVVMSSPEIKEVPETFKTFWLVVHILFAKLTYGFNLIGAAFAVLYLHKLRHATGSAALIRQSGVSFVDRLPTGEELDEWSYLCISCGFVFLTVMIISGSIWANSAWGSYWSWDPVETWSLIAWLVYGLYLHLRRTLNWRGVVVTWIGIIAFLLILFALIGLGFLDAGMHSQYLA